MAALRKLADLLNASWDLIVGFKGEAMPIPAVDDYFSEEYDRQLAPESLGQNDAGQQKSGSSPTPNVPELGGNRNTKARKAMPAA